MKNIRNSIVAVLTVMLTACVAMPHPKYQQHAILINGDGKLEKPNTVNIGGFAEVEDAVVEDTCASQNNDHGMYYPEIFNKVEKFLGDATPENPKGILIFVHGGLNTQFNSTQRVNQVIEAYLDGRLKGQDDDKSVSYYPILINWDSGLIESYGSHLFSLRQGISRPAWGAITSPAYFIADVGRSIVRFPIVDGQTIYRNLQAVPKVQDWDILCCEKKNSEILYTEEKRRYVTNISRGQPLDWGWQSVYKIPYNFIATIPQMVTAPFIDGLGAPSWESMQHRAKMVFERAEITNINGEECRVKDAVEGKLMSAMDKFAHDLGRFKCKEFDKNDEKNKKCKEERKSYNITLVAHSMGTFITNELIRKYPHIDYKNIVYMGGADSIRNTKNTVLNYMKMCIGEQAGANQHNTCKESHPNTKFYNLTLHPQSEVEEANWLGVLPRGSLLVWIDDFFSRPHTPLDLTVGRWSNLAQTYGGFIPEELRNRVFIKAFDQTSSITKHGDFSSATFWKDDFWKPGKANTNPWPMSSYDAFYVPSYK